ncbi:MAG: hypothetical protein MJ057_04645 [Sphaerochaetaceae bacterium]|nr:hypothetical protein [Sphaerochaetaceae bacterium]
MAQHERFHYKSLAEVQDKCKELGITIPFASDTSAIAQPLTFRNVTLSNRVGSAPMEGADSTIEGSPSDLTIRRYSKIAEGGAAIMWFEAISVVPEGRSSNTQLLITKDNVDDYRRMTDTIKEIGLKTNGYAPYLVMQANHSGRYSNPGNKPAPLIAYRHPWLEKFRAADDSCIVSDDYLKQMEESFGEGSRLAKLAGFDAVDIKSCHGYLFQEVASAFYRVGIYGGSYENRTRLLKNSIRAAQVYEDESFMVTSRVGIYDGYPEYAGFGQKTDGSMALDLTEPIRLVKELHEMGLDLVDLTMGNPYATTHVVRPYDMGKYPPEEHPFEGISRMIMGIGEVKKAVPELKILASAPTYLREFTDLYTAGAIEQGLCDGMLFGRMQFADPDFAKEMVGGRIDPKRICLTCGKCGDLIRSHKPTGCVIRDNKTFMPYYKEFLEEKKNLPANFRG